MNEYFIRLLTALLGWYCGILKHNEDAGTHKLNKLKRENEVNSTQVCCNGRAISTNAAGSLRALVFTVKFNPPRMSATSCRGAVVAPRAQRVPVQPDGAGEVRLFLRVVARRHPQGELQLHALKHVERRYASRYPPTLAK